MTPAQVMAAIEILKVLAPLGIEIGQAIASAVQAVNAGRLSPEELAQAVTVLESDATFRAHLAAQDAGG